MLKSVGVLRTDIEIKKIKSEERNFRWKEYGFLILFSGKKNSVESELCEFKLTFRRYPAPLYIERICLGR